MSLLPIELTPLSHSEEPEWLSGRVASSLGTVSSILPSGFDTYLRVLHPFRHGEEPLSWARVLSELTPAVCISSQISMRTIEHAPGFCEMQRRLEIDSPEAGEIPRDVVLQLGRFLEPRDAIQEIFAGVWDGWGPLQRVVRSGRRFETTRTWHLYIGSIGSIAAGIPNGSGRRLTPSIWWPPGHDWVVFTDVDHYCSYVGCSAEKGNLLLQAGALEVFEVQPDDLAYD